MINIKIFSISFAYIIIALICFYGTGLSYYDFGYYLVKFNNLFSSPNILFFGHFQPVQILYSIFYKILGVSGIFIFNLFLLFSGLLILFKSYKNNDFLLIFILFPTIFINFFINFSPELIIIPITFLFFNLFYNNKYLYSFLVISSIIFIKEIYCFQLFFFGFLFLYKKKYIYFLILSLVSIISYYTLSNIIISDINNYIPTINNSVIDIINFKAIFIDLDKKLFFLLFNIWPLIFFLNKKKLIILLPIIPYFIFILFSANTNYYSILSHYSLPIVAILLIYIYESPINPKYYKFFIFSFIVINLSIFSYYINRNVNIYLFNKSYFENNNAIDDYIFDHHSVTITNKITYSSLYKRKFLFSFPNNIMGVNQYQNYFFNNRFYSDFVVIDLNQTLFINDKIIKKNDFINSDYYEILTKNYSIIYKKNGFEIHEIN